ncbi:LysR family transcriptional regulator [Actinoplanes sp. N902-109]|uniref:LysR family transcriptional regulator n=1 Tax=Actinoplanes sp. (strain N902-109) TaxID=649831 RepID=UPI0003295362|nr:LysR family transcriptional regulator [Actinoplanes sp. N902-109]AGL15190.1 LysR family transcriptional regulator [Actinoplanes sp. N902-109]
MDLVASCAAFVAVSRAGSFTRGAAAAGIPQPVASRRIAALEQHLGTPVLDRTSRSVVLTPFGRDMLPAAQRLVDLADAIQDDAERARRRTVELAVPVGWPAPALARLIAAGHADGLYFDVVPAGPGQRAEMLRAREVHAAVVAVPPGDGGWTVPLGLASADPGTSGYLDSLRPARGDATAPRRVWVQPEDAVPHVLDRLVRLGNAVGLQASQVRTARTVPGAVARVLSEQDLLLCSPVEAGTFGLSWRPVEEESFRRGYTVLSAVPKDAMRMRTALHTAVAECLGVQP